MENLLLIDPLDIIFTYGYLWGFDNICLSNIMIQE